LATFQVRTAVLLKFQAVWDFAPCKGKGKGKFEGKGHPITGREGPEME